MSLSGIKWGKPPSRREIRNIERQEREWHAEIRALMDKGMSFDDAWVSAGGQIVPLAETPSANAGMPK